MLVYLQLLGSNILVLNNETMSGIKLFRLSSNLWDKINEYLKSNGYQVVNWKTWLKLDPACREIPDIDKQAEEEIKFRCLERGVWGS